MSSQTLTLEPELRTALKKLKLGQLIDTLPERRCRRSEEIQTPLGN